MEEILHVFGVDWRLLIVQAINFGLALGILTYFLYRPVMRMMEERQRTIEQGVRDAEEAAKKKAHAEGERTEIVRHAEREAEKIVEDARTHGRTKGEEIVKNAQEKSERLMKEAEARAAEEARLIVERSKEDVARLAILAAEKVLREK